MKVIVFVTFIMIGVLFYTDVFIYTRVERIIPISGDGEYVMDHFEMAILLVKALVCAVGAGAVITLFRTR